MKLKIFTLAFFSVFFNSVSISCPIWLEGKIIVVDENGRVLDAQIWKIRNKDSFQLNKGAQYDWGNNEDDNQINVNSDTNFFEFWTGGGWYFTESERPFLIHYRVRVPGYADVIIKDIDFNYSFEKVLPVLFVKMYPKRFYKSADKMSLIDRYVYDKVFEVNDTAELNFVNYMEYLQINSDNVMRGENKTLLAVESYPNPVTDYIILKINTAITEPYTLKLMDMQGKLVKQSALTMQETKYDLQWQAKGNYIVMVYDPKGNPIFSRQFVKM
ncbi:MAG: T9SS type A sorting domain-containing protein [Bacteroidia bacterium]